MQERKGNADTETGLGDPAGEGESGTNGEGNTDIYTPSCPWGHGTTLYSP